MTLALMGRRLGKLEIEVAGMRGELRALIVGFGVVVTLGAALVSF